jgi:hypothetical protein
MWLHMGWHGIDLSGREYFGLIINVISIKPGHFAGFFFGYWKCKTGASGNWRVVEGHKQGSVFPVMFGKAPI